jgi:hypothetical protein
MRRKKLLFGQFDEKESGTTKLWNLFTTTPWHIRKHSSFLALHLTTVALILGLLIAYSLVALYPLLSTLRADNYESQFRVLDASGKDLSLSLCDKPANVSNFMLRTSVGSFCSLDKYSSPYDCAVSCLLKRPQRRGENLCKLTPKEECGAHAPCAAPVPAASSQACF